MKEFAALWLQREKEELHARIEKRVEEMFAKGWRDEVRGLIAKYGAEKVKAFPGIGYREIAEAARAAGTSAFPSATWERGYDET